MRVKSLGANKTEVETTECIILVSYETPVAAYSKILRKYFRTDTFYSVTTSKHINQWLDGINAETVSQDRINKLLD